MPSIAVKLSGYDQEGSVIKRDDATPSPTPSDFGSCDAVPTLFLHWWHELADIVPTANQPTDRKGRRFEQFVAEVERARREGWKVFDRWERELQRAIRPKGERA
jgi:hypothetical protein